MASKLSLAETLDLIFGLFQFILQIIQYKIISLLGIEFSLAREKNLGIFKISYVCRRFSIQQIRAITGECSTRPTYLRYCESRNIKPCIEPVPRGGHALWVDKKQSPEKAFVFIHGGGFHVGLSSGHIKFIDSVITEAKKSGVSLSTVILEYDLAPESRYPTQLIQAISLFEHILGSGISPSQIILGGESAGGNLILGLLSHILHPNPEFPILPELVSQIGGAIIISPWVSFDTNSESMQGYNSEHDTIFPGIIDAWASSYLGLKEARNPYSEPMRAPEGWWSDLQSVVKRILITAGAEEVMRDDLVKFSQVLEGVKGVEFNLEKGPHAVPIHSNEESGPEGSVMWSKQVRWVGETLKEI
ncbi:Alpha/Beta hydrolase protein [Morchella snyderi]|nr:Alpha/Beta hydrolase protein [Morchella snyderi]